VAEVPKSAKQVDPESPKAADAKGDKGEDANDAESRKQARTKGYVYGAKTTAAKMRRCGECEGCMRDDCGDCLACKDKPRFGGSGTMKRACVARTCRMRASAGVKIEEAEEGDQEEVPAVADAADLLLEAAQAAEAIVAV